MTKKKFARLAEEAIVEGWGGLIQYLVWLRLIHPEVYAKLHRKVIGLRVIK